MAEKELVIDEELIPLYGDFIHIPAQRLFWRGYDASFPAISDRPAYYSSQGIAMGYLRHETDILGTFMNTRPLRLLDVRYVKVILRQLLEDIKIKKEYSNPGKDADVDAAHIKVMTASFGLCSLHHQIELLKHIFFHDIQGSNRKERIYEMIETNENMKGLKNLITYYEEQTYPLIEQQGFRVGETFLDATTMYFLQHFFSGFADGFVSPRLISPYHVEKEGVMSQEMILFNPQASGIIQTSLPTEKLETELVSSLILQTKKQIVLENGNFATPLYNPKKSGGGYGKEHSLNTLERKIMEKDPVILTLCHNGIQCAKRWEKKYVKIYQTEPPVPSNPIMIRKR